MIADMISDVNPGTGGSKKKLSGRVITNTRISDGLLRLDLELESSTSFEPGQFAMLNLNGARKLIFSRPFSILDCDRERISFLYRVVGRGTTLLAQLISGDPIEYLGPLGTPFPAPTTDQPVVLLAGGVGLPPMWAWWQRYGTRNDRAYFGGRDGLDVPWMLLDDNWRISVDHKRDLPQGKEVFGGVVTDLCASELEKADSGERLVLSCGPLPLLKAAANMARKNGWRCLVSVEEHMGCGYGVCKGCVVPLLGDTKHPDRDYVNATACGQGPVFDAEKIDWNRFERTTD